MKLIVKFGEYYDNSNDELLILPQGSHSINLDQFLYEMVVLSMPIRNVHPGIEDGSIKSDIINRLKDLKKKRNNLEVQSSLGILKTVAKTDENVMPQIINCARSRCTLREISDVLRKVYGEY